MKESDFKSWICTTLRSQGVDCQTIESSTGSGIPDINCCNMSVHNHSETGNEFWIEVKIVKTNAKTAIRSAQYAWAMRRVKCGGQVFVVSYYTKPKMVHIWDIDDTFKVDVISKDNIKIISEPDWVIPKKDFNITLF